MEIVEKVNRRLLIGLRPQLLQELQALRASGIDEAGGLLGPTQRHSVSYESLQQHMHPDGRFKDLAIFKIDEHDRRQ
ncbi:hypothetical protein [Burkholderia ambifaria]|uniref:hypothetical protein n=1 Tax=Burkholderia ambifaria TaxID=152480 RepID=UPI00158FAD66|nr:hypothetical protein [Burkholderia ambifaria]